MGREKELNTNVMLKLAFPLIVLLECLYQVSGHGNMVWPPVWLDADAEIGITSGQQCLADGGVVANCMWFTNYTFIEHAPTLPDEFRTYQDIYIEGAGYWDIYKEMPWRSPGTAPVFSPCGVAGGNPDGCPSGSMNNGEYQDCPGGGFGFGPSAEDVEFPRAVTTDWVRGQRAEVGWGIIANHGGGYSYRLCKVPEEGMSAITEECFQQGHLDFAGDMQWVQYGPGGEKVEFMANRTREGTYPPGSQWTKNPIPACYPYGGYMEEDSSACVNGVQFPPPAPGLQGFGENFKAPGYPLFLFTIMDEVQVPSIIEPGEYVLSFRWDCEQTYQIWNMCSSINIV